MELLESQRWALIEISWGLALYTLVFFFDQTLVGRLLFDTNGFQTKPKQNQHSIQQAGITTRGFSFFTFQTFQALIISLICFGLETSSLQKLSIPKFFQTYRYLTTWQCRFSIIFKFCECRPLRQELRVEQFRQNFLKVVA